MAIKITLKSTKIPVEIGGMKFYFDMTDENLLKMDKALTSHQKAAVELEQDIEAGKLTDPAEIVKATTNFLRIAFDAILDAGAFDKLYEKYPSSGTLAMVLLEVCKEIKAQDTKSNADMMRFVNEL